MLGAFANAFRTPDLRRKLLFVLLIIVIFRLGSQVPLPASTSPTCTHQPGGGRGVYSLINLFSGGALLQLTIFALGIMPYITASIILQLLVVVIPRLEALKKEGQADRPRSRSTPATSPWGWPAAGDRHRGAGPPASCSRAAACRCCTRQRFTFLVMVITMTAGTAVIMWLGELITDRGIGNGMSILIFTQVVATFPPRCGRSASRAGGSSRS